MADGGDNLRNLLKQMLVLETLQLPSLAGQASATTGETITDHQRQVSPSQIRPPELIKETTQVDESESEEFEIVSKKDVMDSIALMDPASPEPLFMQNGKECGQVSEERVRGVPDDDVEMSPDNFIHRPVPLKPSENEIRILKYESGREGAATYYNKYYVNGSPGKVYDLTQDPANVIMREGRQISADKMLASRRSSDVSAEQMLKMQNDFAELVPPILLESTESDVSSDDVIVEDDHRDPGEYQLTDDVPVLENIENSRERYDRCTCNPCSYCYK